MVMIKNAIKAASKRMRKPFLTLFFVGKMFLPEVETYQNQ